MSVLTKWLGLPSFLFSVFVFYWSLPIFAILYRIRFASLGKRNDMLDWARALVAYFRVTLLQAGEHTLYKGGPCLYLCNHRSWADFFIDAYLTEGRAALMSRWLVYFVFPVFCTSCMILKGIVLFKRGTIADKEAFNAWLDQTLGSSHVPGLLVYPEGHRSTKPASLPLKRGMLHYAHSRKLPVQIVVTRGKDEVLSEKSQSVHFGRTCVTTFSKVLKSADYPNFEAFFTDLQATWDSCWAATYGLEDLKNVPRFSMPGPQAYSYSSSMWVQQLAITLVSILVFAGVCYGSWRGLAAALAATGAAQQVVALVLAAWVGSSVLRSFL
ncbi:hypothetical protein CHLRE_17g738350v5 [Chlamydomonas reinhardtii]|uniref:Phospholipid/glycerol acyltransferase domain-containing protein n=1 Tax=Chlamydomonas reinhardtii TaxID=3055 RepID=A0A2K3CRJ9_CHLRE|nr:uncharacterized protein CHLRE_17g738350v5 [Chlamydomonas reinhardtii]PNW70905.1 hypothetical protein CHLRE_17g738350v5 [Chlamydomonas reinhardtii]